jgi:hypothetical protein
MNMVKPATETVATTAPTSGAVGRRALLAVTATAGVCGVCGVTALAVPQLRNTLEQHATALGRQALASYTTANSTNAEAYLKALKKQTQP